VHFKLPSELSDEISVVATVRATNGVGLSTTSSQHVVIRRLEPTIATSPMLESIFGNPWTEAGYSPSGQALKVVWQRDRDSTIKHRVRLLSSDGSEAPVSQELGQFGSDGVVLTDLKLHDGNTYIALGMPGMSCYYYVT